LHFCLQVMEESKARVGIREWGITQTSLEEVCSWPSAADRLLVWRCGPELCPLHPASLTLGVQRARSFQPQYPHMHSRRAMHCWLSLGHASQSATLGECLCTSHRCLSKSWSGPRQPPTPWTHPQAPPPAALRPPTPRHRVPRATRLRTRSGTGLAVCRQCELLNITLNNCQDGVFHQPLPPP
jgi:hypothetical protein